MVPYILYKCNKLKIDDDNGNDCNIILILLFPFITSIIRFKYTTRTYRVELQHFIEHFSYEINFLFNVHNLLELQPQ